MSVIVVALLARLALAAEPAGDTGSTEEPAPLTEVPALLDFKEAVYPDAARAAGAEATVLLAISIDAAGAVTSVEVVTPAGQGFDEAAAEAARQMRFSPARDASGPVAVVLEFAYQFKLDAAPAPGGEGSAAAPPPVPEIPDDAPVNLEVLLLEMGTRRPLAGFPVRVEPADPASELAPREGTTGPDGKLSVRGLAAGAWRVRAGQPGWDPVAQPVTVAADSVTTARLWARNQAYGDQGIVGVYSVPTVDVSKRTITMDEIKKVPGTFGDPVRVVQSLPGAARAAFGSGVLIIRGSNPEDSGVYVDGIRIPFIYHLGGFASVINPELVESVDYLPGGFGPRYGRSMGGVIDVSTKKRFPERTKVAWNTDLLDSGGVVMGSAGKDHQHGFGLAARRSYIDAILPLFLDDGFTVKPRWFDYQAKYQYQGKAPWTFSVLAFGFNDTLEAQTPPGFARGSDPSAQGDLGTEYSTHRVVVDASTPLGGDWTFRTTTAFGRDDANLLLGDDLRLDQGQWLLTSRVEAPWAPSKHLRVVPGIDYLSGLADFDVRFPFNPQSFADFDPLAEREPFGFSGTQWGWGPDAYVLAEVRPLKDPDALLLAPGVRLDYVNIPDQAEIVALDPRFSMKWQAARGTLVKGSAGLYHQPPQPFQLYRREGAPIDLVAEQSLSTSLGIEQRLGEAVQLDVEVFQKQMTDLVVDNPDFQTLADPFFLNEGVGRVVGIETLLRRERVGNLFGWVSYTLSRSERKDHPDEDWYAFDADQTHIFTAVGGYRLPYDVEVSGKGEYTTGNPTTPRSLGIYDVDQNFYRGFSAGPRNSERLPAYWALSLRADKLFTFKTWQLALYCDFLNVARGVNPEFEINNYDYTERSYVRGLPFLPSPGFEAKFEL